MFNLLFIFKVEKKILLEEEGNIKEKNKNIDWW